MVTTQEHTIGGRTWQIALNPDQDELLAAVQTDEDLANFPYGLMLWPSAVGLCEALAESPSLVNGLRVLEIGAGIGLVGLVAAGQGARSVTQTDYHRDALALCRENVRRNGVENLAVRAGDWRDWPDDLTDFPVVLGADILYERELHATLLALLPRLVAPNGLLIIADPLRPQARDFFLQLDETGAWNVEHRVRAVTWDGAPKEIALHYLTSVRDKEISCSSPVPRKRGS